MWNYLYNASEHFVSFLLKLPIMIRCILKFLSFWLLLIFISDNCWGNNEDKRWKVQIPYSDQKMSHHDVYCGRQGAISYPKSVYGTDRSTQGRKIVSMLIMVPFHIMLCSLNLAMMLLKSCWTVSHSAGSADLSLWPRRSSVRKGSFLSSSKAVLGIVLGLTSIFHYTFHH